MTRIKKPIFKVRKIRKIRVWQRGKQSSYGSPYVKGASSSL